MAKKNRAVLRMVKALAAVLATIPFGICWFEFYAMGLFMQPFYYKGNYYVIFLFLFFYCLFARVYDAFLVSINKLSEMVYSQMLSLFLADGVMYLVTCLLFRRLPNPLPLAGCFAVQAGWAALWSITARSWYFKTFPPKKTAIIYETNADMETLIEDYGLSKKFDVVLKCQINDCLASDFAPIRENNIEVIYMRDVRSHERNKVLKYCIRNGVTAYVVPRVGDMIMTHAKKMHMFHLPILRVERDHPDFEYYLIKRTFDILVSGTALFVFLPLIAVTGVAIKLCDGGPIIYSQMRMTKDGREFRIFKFRSMRVDAEDKQAILSSGDQDDRITSVGRVIRKIRFDEIPQLINVLKGDMSIVGPRPERPEIAREYERVMPEFSLRLQVKAGLTGYAQVYGKYNTSPYDKLQMDLMYIANQGIFQDIGICFATVKILFMSESTEGFGVGHTTVMNSENSTNNTEKIAK